MICVHVMYILCTYNVHKFECVFTAYFIYCRILGHQKIYLSHFIFFLQILMVRKLTDRFDCWINCFLSPLYNYFIYFFLIRKNKLVVIMFAVKYQKN